MTGEQLAAVISATLQIDPQSEIERISRFIHAEVIRRGSHGVVIGLSGGLDSSVCAFLCARSLPPQQIHLFSLPERDSNAYIHENAHLVAEALSLPLMERDLTELFDWLGLYEKVPPELAANRHTLERSIKILGRFSQTPALYPWAQQFAFGQRRGFFAQVMRRWLWPYASITESFIFGKIRARSLVLGLKAMLLDCLLICTTDRSEMTVGFYDPHGDGVGDIAPLIHLYKTQIRRLAQALELPGEILAQPSSADLAGGLPNETAIGLPYERLDRALAGISLGWSDAEVSRAAGLRRTMVRAVRSACQVANARRNMPVSLADEDKAG